jgi:hypothetical protein
MGSHCTLLLAIVKLAFGSTPPVQNWPFVPGNFVTQRDTPKQSENHDFASMISGQNRRSCTFVKPQSTRSTCRFENCPSTRFQVLPKSPYRTFLPWICDSYKNHATDNAWYKKECDQPGCELPGVDQPCLKPIRITGRLRRTYLLLLPYMLLVDSITFHLLLSHSYS